MYINQEACPGGKSRPRQPDGMEINQNQNTLLLTATYLNTA